MHCDNRLILNGLDHHFDCANAPNVVSIPDINLFTHVNFINFFLELPSNEITFLCLPLNLDVWVLGVRYQLRNDIVDPEAREKNRALSSANSFFADETRFFNYQVLVKAFCAETMAADRSLALVNKFEAEGAKQTFCVLSLINVDTK